MAKEKRPRGKLNLESVKSNLDLKSLYSKIKSRKNIFIEDINGNIAVIFGLSIGVICIFLCAAIDIAHLLSSDQKLQNRLDASTLYLATLPSGSDLQKEGLAYLKDYSNTDVVYNLEATFEPINNQIVATARGDIKLLFGGLVGRSMSAISAETTVNLSRGIQPCIIALSKTNSPGILLNEGATIQAETCEVHVHSERNPAMTINAETTLKPYRTCVAGDYISHHSSEYDDVETGCDVVDDPFVNIIPEPDQSRCDYNSAVYAEGEFRLRPGTYCGWHNFRGPELNLELEPGLYVIRNGGWVIGEGNLEAEGVTFYFEDQSTFQFNENITAKISAPTNGPYVDVLFAEVSGLSRAQFVINDNLGFDFEGIIHLPSKEIVLNGGATVRSRDLSIVADTIIINNAELNINKGRPSQTDQNLIYISK